MIDFIKIRIDNPDIPGIRNNPRLEWIQRINEKTGEVKEYTATFHGLTFQIVDNQYLNISGSLHKHWNAINEQGDQNYNDFKLLDLAGAIMNVCEWFNLLPGNCIIENFEFGVNVIPPIPVTEILRSVINHKGKPFNRQYSCKMNYLECSHRQYYLKMYDKGLQFDQGNKLRFEIKTRKMEIVKPANIEKLSDLLIQDNMNRLGTILTGNFNDILFYDYTIPEKEINARERLVLTQGQNPLFWQEYKDTTPDNYFKKRNRFKDLVKKFGNQDIQEIVFPLIGQKWIELLTIDLKTLQELTGGKKPNITGIDTSNIGTNTVMLDMNDPAYEHPQRRYCLTCGNDITNQRSGSMFCGAKYVGYSRAHRCRNIDSNPRNRIRYILDQERINPTLFETTPFFIHYRQLSTN
jgi:hypothetical protein